MFVCCTYTVKILCAQFIFFWQFVKSQIFDIFLYFRKNTFVNNYFWWHSSVNDLGLIKHQYHSILPSTVWDFRHFHFHDILKLFMIFTPKSRFFFVWLCQWDIKTPWANKLHGPPRIQHVPGNFTGCCIRLEIHMISPIS